jgi:catalase
MHISLALLGLTGLASAACPFMDAGPGLKERSETPVGSIEQRNTDVQTDSQFLAQFVVDDTNSFLTSDVGGPIEDNHSLKAGERGPTLLEDFIFRQKIQHFDHERVSFSINTFCQPADVNRRSLNVLFMLVVPVRIFLVGDRNNNLTSLGAHGIFTSYGDYSNVTAASFLNTAGKQTPVFVRFSTVAGSRGSADTARDVHGFATRFYTDEGNFGKSCNINFPYTCVDFVLLDIVGNNIPVFFIQDAILFPDLIHAVKPAPDREIPQAATAHDSAWDFFSQQPSSLHTLFWAMAGNGIPRSFRHMDGFGIHTFRFVTDAGDSKLIKWFWKTKQGKASLVWEEAQVLAGKNADFHRLDLWNAIASGNGPEWELGVQIVDEADAQSFGFDLLDPTKIIPEELVPVQLIGSMKLDTNPTNYFAETEQVMVRLGSLSAHSYTDHNSSNPAISSAVSTSPKILFFKAASSRT